MHILPPSLEDQVYNAYALDDMHARILLLKFEGIDISPDDDPCIAAVQDEDCDLCFFPNAKLISDGEEKALLSQQRECKRRRRDERMRACEYVWDHAKRRMRDERLWLRRRRDFEERRKAMEGAERQRVLKDREPRLQRNAVSYDHLIQSVFQPPSPEDPLAIIQDSASWHKHSGSSAPPPSLVRNYTRSMDSSRPVSFKDVLAAMEGPLFPLTSDERQHRLSGKDQLKQAGLLDSLLVKYDQPWMAKATNIDIGSSVPLACKRCSVDLLSLTPSSSPSSISSCPSLTTSSSWLSYVSRSSRSSEPKSPPAPSFPKFSTWLRRSNLPACRGRQQQSKRAPVLLSESPLHIDMSVKLVGSGKKCGAKRVSRRRSLFGATSTIMGHLVDAAKQLQRAYMTVAVCNIAELHGMDEDVDGYLHNEWKPVGARARSKDVKIFLGATEIHDSTPVQYIPLVSPGDPPECPPRTILSDPLPYPIVFKPHPPICRSPFRLTESGRHGTRDRPQKLKSAITDSNTCDGANLRVRLVSNPAFLRLKALQNVLYERGFIWEGHGNDCGLSNGKETLHGVAVEGLGRSLLSVY